MFRALGWCSGIIGLSALGFMALAYAEGVEALAARFALSGIIGLVLGGITLGLTQQYKAPAGPAAALRLALLSWVLMPLLASPVFVFQNASLLGGIFEAYSAMTTTGAVLSAPESLPQSLLLWRCYLAWIGGLASLVLAATLFAALDRRGVGLRRTSLLTVERSDLFTNFGTALRRLGVIYLGLTVLGVVVLSMTGVEAFEALCLAMSAVATAGLSPHSGPLAQSWGAATISALALLCLLGAWNFAVMLDIAARQRLQRGTGELRAMIIVAIGVGLGVGIIAAGSIPLGALSMLDSLFAITTAGYTTHGVFSPPPSLLLLLALVGGATISTSGGMKMPRVLVLLRRAGGEISLLSHPSAAVRTRYAGRNVKSEALTGVWVYTLVYPIALAVGTILIAFGGASFSDAWQVSAASLSNAGPLADVDYNQLPVGALIASMILMIAGRLEILAAAAAIFVIFADD